MKFQNIEIVNFLAITEATFQLADRGLVLIQGSNKDDTSADSNGSGKSSLADALCWALYGITARGVSGDDVINHSAGKNTNVSVQLSDEDNVYEISRNRKNGKLKNSLTVSVKNTSSGTSADLTKGTDKLTQEVVNEIIGSSYEVFKNSVYAGQEQMPDLPSMTDKALKVLIEEASGVTLLELAHEEAKRRLSSQKSVVSDKQAEIDTIKNRLVADRSNLTNLQANKDTWDANQAPKITSMEARITDQKNRIVKMVSDAKKTDIGALQSKVAEIDGQISSVSSDQQKLADMISAIAKSEAHDAALAREQHRVCQAVERKEKEVVSINDRIGCPCGECGREITAAEIETAKNATEKSVLDLKGELSKVEQDIKQNLASTQKLTDERNKFASSMIDISHASAERSRIAQEIEVYNRQLSDARKEAASHKSAVADLEKLKAEINPFIAPIDDGKQSMKKLLDTCKGFEKQLKDETEKLEQAESVVKVFSPAGVRAHILDEVTPFLNQQTTKYLSVMSDGNIDANWTTLVKNSKGELREKFSIEVSKSNGASVFSGLSGGEKRKVRVATSLALQDLVATRATKPIELFIGDEIDDALDSAGLERLTQILSEKAEERGSVFIISHNSLSDWVSQVLTVEMESGKTKIIETSD